MTKSERARLWYKKNAERIKTKFRYRYAKDPQFREAKKKYSLETYAANPEQRIKKVMSRIDVLKSEGKWDWTQRFAQIKHRYNLTEERYKALLFFQDGACACCREPFTSTPRVDHDHNCCGSSKSCGECVRGLLCDRCNRLLGNAKDKTETLKAAINYLSRVPSNKLNVT